MCKVQAPVHDTNNHVASRGVKRWRSPFVTRLNRFGQPFEQLGVVQLHIRTVWRTLSFEARHFSLFADVQDRAALDDSNCDDFAELCNDAHAGRDNAGLSKSDDCGYFIFAVTLLQYFPQFRIHLQTSDVQWKATSS